MKHVSRRAARGGTAGLAALLVASSILAGIPAVAAPDNDHFADAKIIASLPAIEHASTFLAASRETGEPDCARGERTVWYAFTPAVDLRIEADTFGSTYDTALAVYTGTGLTSLTQRACNDDAEPVHVRPRVRADLTADTMVTAMLATGFTDSGTFLSRVVLDVAAGTTYYFQVGAVPGGTQPVTLSGLTTGGDLVLRVFAVAGPVNDHFADALPVEATPFSDRLSSATATLEPGEAALPACGAVFRQTVWYRYVATERAALVANTEGSNFDTILAVYRGSSPSNLTLVACNDDVFQQSEVLQENPRSEAAFTVEVGEIYYIRVGAATAVPGPRDLTTQVFGTPLDKPPACRQEVTRPTSHCFLYVTLGVDGAVELSAFGAGRKVQAAPARVDLLRRGVLQTRCEYGGPPNPGPHPCTPNISVLNDYPAGTELECSAYGWAIESSSQFGCASAG